MKQDNFRGNKVIKEITFFVNNKQGIELNEMKNNWALWQKVKSQEVQVGQGLVTMEFTLPVTAQNVLIQLSTVNTSRVINKAERKKERKEKKATVESLDEVSGIDMVISTLPKAVAASLGMVEGRSNESREEILGENEPMMCPRCGRQVQGRQGICNSCGESAQQCQKCRNINYDKPDGFLCNECGSSRFAQFEFALTYKPGVASEKIETEEQKTQAMNQIEQNLQSA